MLAQLRHHNEREIHAAGPRYGPGIDPAAPNVTVEPLLLTLGCLAIDSAFGAHLRTLAKALSEATRYAPPELDRLFRGRANTPATVVAAIEALARTTPDTVARTLQRLGSTTVRVSSAIARFQSGISARAEKEYQEANPGQRRESSELAARIRSVDRPLDDIIEFLGSTGTTVLTTNRLLLLGHWGTGKTHALCDLTRHRDRNNLPTLFALAQHFPAGMNPLDTIALRSGIATNGAELLRALDDAGRACNQRALLLIDGINEGSHPTWRRWIPHIERAVARHRHVGLVLSCRTPFEEQIVPKRQLGRWPKFTHAGFADVEFDAQLEFFTYYRIPAPDVPLLTPEFSRPLFLKIICETIRRLGTNASRTYLRDLASGQKGMTRALEDFARYIGNPIEDDFGLPRKSCWLTLKAIAGTMAEKLREHVTWDEATAALITLVPGTGANRARAILDRFVADGLLLSDVNWHFHDDNTTTTEPILKLPYQRFSDHLIARHLLEQHLDVESQQSIRRSFYANRPLGKVFAVRAGHQFEKPGIASAIMLEFPERVKRALDADNRELVFHLPRARQLGAPLREVFLQGLPWRSRDSFGKDTSRLIDYFLNRFNEYSRAETMEILVGLATRHDHPLKATRLYDYLERMSLPDRDLLWSEFLRGLHEQSVVYRIIEWIERSDAALLRPDSAANYLTLLSVFLTTTRKALRDRATFALFLIGLRHPKALFDWTLATMSFNDLWVSERLLAASAGVAMNRWADPAGDAVRAELPVYARLVVDAMFRKNAPFATRHVLRRDYALIAIELARRVDRHAIAAVDLPLLAPPYSQLPTGFPPPNRIQRASVEPMRDGIHMDFGNYTIGRLVRDRGNYQEDHPEYKRVFKQILWRMRDLGYDSERFKEVDRQIANSGWRARANDAERVERYGKKYSWIGFFEMYGLQQDRDRLPDYRQNDRSSDADIDPSFPAAARTWQPSLPDIFTVSPDAPREWIEHGPVPNYDHLLQVDTIEDAPGPWTLVEGYVDEGAPDPSDERRTFTFLRGVLVGNRDLDDLISRFEAARRPGYTEVPDWHDDPYTYAGEIPWSVRFGRALRDSTGVAERDVRTAFGHWNGSRTVGTPVEILAIRYQWESYHSSLNKVSGILVPAPALATAFALTNHSRDWDLYEADGRRATAYREFGATRATHRSQLLYVRSDLLQGYAAATSSRLVTIIWGEREFRYDMHMAVADSLSDLYQRCAHVHKRIVVSGV